LPAKSSKKDIDHVSNIDYSLPMSRLTKPTFDEAKAYLLGKYGSWNAAAKAIGMTPHNLRRVVSDDPTMTRIERTREWLCLKVWEEQLG
jgi:hypothetical protein